MSALAERDNIIRNAREVLGKPDSRRSRIFDKVNGKRTSIEIAKLTGYTVNNVAKELTIMGDSGLLKVVGKKRKAIIYHKIPQLRHVNLWSRRTSRLPETSVTKTSEIARSKPVQMPIQRAARQKQRVKIAFVGHGFDPKDEELIRDFKKFFEALGFNIQTGEEVDIQNKIPEKIKQRIKPCDYFIGIFAREDKLAGKNEWTTSTWVISEMSFAISLGKTLILLVENGVKKFGGLQGADLEYIPFDRTQLHKAYIKINQAVSKLL